MPPTITHPRGSDLAIAVILAYLLLVPPVAAQSGEGDPSRPRDTLDRRSWNLELSSHAGFETWNYNGSHEEMYSVVAGLSYGIRDGLALTAAAPLYYVDQRGIDGWLLGVTAGVRGRILRKGRVTAFWEFEVGISEADTFTPPRGTRFNYLALGGAGATIRIRPGIHLLASLKWVHVSNNGLAGRDRNPDIEAVGPRVGVALGF